MNLDQPGAGFWDSYMSENSNLNTSELSAANLQSFVHNNAIDDMAFPNNISNNGGNVNNNSNVDNNNTSNVMLLNDPFFPNSQTTGSSSSNVASEQLSNSPLSNNAANANTLNQLNSNIYQTQSEISSIKQELGYDSILISARHNTNATDNSTNNNSSRQNVSAAIIDKSSTGGNNSSADSGKTIVDKRKSQNRAAQRAFRERKEQKLKELQKKLEESEQEKRNVLKELEKLKMKNLIISTENQMLLKNKNLQESAVSQQQQQQQQHLNDDTKTNFQQQQNGQISSSNISQFQKFSHPNHSSPSNDINTNNNHNSSTSNQNSLVNNNSTYTFPCAEENQTVPAVPSYSDPFRAIPTASNTIATSQNAAQIAQQHNATSASSKLIYADPTDKSSKLLSTAAVWDYVSQFEELNHDCDIDVIKLMSSLEGTEKCYGLGPAYSLKNLNDAILKQLEC